MSASTVLVRADASVAAGTGHVMRCLALAQAWQDAGGRAVFAMAESNAAIDARLRAESFEVLPISASAGTANDELQTEALARSQNAGWVVIDGYRFDAGYEQALKKAGFRVLFLDDYGHSSHYSADLILNQNVNACEMMYASRESSTRLLLGPRYSLLRREFNAWCGRKKEVSPVCRHLMVMMGGSDAGNVTAKIIEALALAGAANLETTIIAGGSNPHFGALEECIGQSQNIRLRRDVQNVAELMADADLAISAAGSTCWELCLFGLPALLLDVAENQTAVAKELDRRQCAIHVGDQNSSVEAIAGQLRRLVDSYELRRSLSQRSRELVDGRGASRVVSIMAEMGGARTVENIRASSKA